MCYFFSAPLYSNIDLSDRNTFSSPAATVCGIALASKFPDDLLSRHHWISATSTQQVVLFAVEFRCETSQRCHGIWGGRSK